MDFTANGKTFRPYEFRVERGKIAEFAKALGDMNPVYHDPDSAEAKAAGGLLAPPTLLRTFLYETRDAVEALKVKDWSYIVHGEQEFEYLKPIHAGDVLVAQDRIASMSEKDSRRAGKLQIAVIETTFRNQAGEIVQIARRTLVETGKRIED